jgi:hypothetical protein
MTPRTVSITLAAAAVIAVAVAGWWTSDRSTSEGLSKSERAPTKEFKLGKSSRAATEEATDIKPPEAMSNPATYAAVRLKEIKADPALLSDVWAWRREWSAAHSPALKREVLALAVQVGPEAFLSIRPHAINSGSDEIQMEAVRSLALLPEDRLREGVAIAVSAANEEIRAEAMEVIGQLDPRLQPPLILTAVQVGTPDVQKIAVGMVLDRPSPESFEALLQGLRSEESEARPLFEQAIAQMVQQRFDSYEEATRWWSANRESFDSMMLRGK